MPESNQQDNGDRLDFDILRNAILGEQISEYETKISDLEEQISGVREEMRAQGNEVQSAIEKKIDEILQVIQVAPPQAKETPVSPPNQIPAPTPAQNKPQPVPVAPKFVEQTPPSPAPTPIQNKPQPVPVAPKFVEPTPPSPAPIPQPKASPTPQPPNTPPSVTPPKLDLTPPKVVTPEPTSPKVTTPELTSPEPELPKEPTDTSASVDFFSTQINGILNNQAAPKPETKQEQPTPEPTNTNATINAFAAQINSILTNQVSVETPTNQEQPIEVMASPIPDVIELPSPPPQTTPVTTPQPSAYSAPQTQSSERQQHQHVVPDDRAAQIQQFRDLMWNEEVLRLRQTNAQLDRQLLQIDQYIASSQQPLDELLPLMTDLVQLKIQEAKSVPESVEPVIVQSSNSSESPRPISKPRRFPWRGLLVGLFVLSLIPIGLYGYWLRRIYLFEQEVAIALQTTPELALYRLTPDISPDIRDKTLYLTGRLPRQELSDQAAAIARQTLPDFELSNNILVIEEPLDKAQRQAEIEKILTPLNSVNGIQVDAQLDGDRVTLAGTVLQADDITTIIEAVEQINGIEQITNNIQVETQPISTRVYFDQNSAVVKPRDIDQKLLLVKQYLARYPNINLRIIGYQHPTEYTADVALKRVQAVQLLLEDKGIDRRRIIAFGVKQPPPDITSDDPIWLSRTVIFDIARDTSNAGNP